MKILIFVMAMWAGAWGAAGAAIDTSALLAEGAQAAAQGRLDDAEAAYRRAAAAEPAEGWPALARFFRLTRQEDKLDGLVREMANAAGVTMAAQGRALIAAGRKAEAAALLGGAEPRGADEAILLAGILRRRGDTAGAGGVIWAALAEAAADEAGNAPERGRLFQAMRESGALAAADSATSLALAAEWGIAALAPERKVALEWFDPLLIEFQHHAPDYFRDREGILEAGNAGPGAAWLGARLLIREEDHAAAWDYLKAREAAWRGLETWPLLAEEMIELARILGQPDDATPYVALWKERAGGAAAFREAEIAMARQDWPRALALFAAMDVEALPPVERRAARLMRMRAAVEGGNTAQAVEAFERGAAGAPLEDAATLNKIIFDRWIETKKHWALEHLARERLAKISGADPALWLLAAEAARQARLTPNQIEALYQYTQARPRDAAALAMLAEAVRPIAEELAGVEEKDLAEPKAERGRLTALTEAALKQLVLAMPYEPEHYQALIKFYKATGREEEARRVPDIAAGAAPGAAPNAAVIGVGGYALALSGYPAEAMAYYDRALALEPDNMTIQMNRAACLTRLDRLDEAAEFYRALLENGHNGRAFHPHELVTRIWVIRQHQGRGAECLAYFETLPDAVKGDWADEAMLTAANAAAAAEQLDAARRLIEIIEARSATPEKSALKGWENLALALVEAGRLDEADAVFAAAEKRYGGTAEVDVALTHARAEIRVRRGDAAGAIAVLRGAAEKFPREAAAQEGLFRAGDLAGGSGDAALAVELYEAFLKSGTVQFALRREAAGKIEALKQSEAK